MKSLNTILSTLALTTLAGAAFATTYPENPNPQPPAQPAANTNTNNNGNTNTNNNAANAAAAAAAAAQAHAAAVAAQQQGQAQQQAQGQQQGQGQIATGGAGGAGGSVGNVQGSTASVGNVAGGDSKASVGDVTGGNSKAAATIGDVAGGNSKAASNSGGNSLNNTNNFEASKMANLGSISIMPAANCGSGWGAQLSIPSFAAGIGGSNIDRFCLSQNAAIAALNAGIVTRDKGMQATAIKTLMKMHPEFMGAAAVDIVKNLKKPCAARAAEISVMMLTDDDLQCDGQYLAGTKEYAMELDRLETERQARIAAAVEAERLKAANAPAAVQAAPSVQKMDLDLAIVLEQPAARTVAAGGGKPKVDCVTVRIPAKAESTACVNPDVAKRNNWLVVPKAP